MRPLLGDDTFQGRCRSTSCDDSTPLATRTQPPQMSYFIADERSMGDSQSSPSIVPKRRNTTRQSKYGVESLETTINSLEHDTSDFNDRPDRRRQDNYQSKGSEGGLARAVSPSWRLSADVSRNASPSHRRRASQSMISRPVTPLSFGSRAPASLISSPGSRENSDTGSYMDDIASQAIMSSGEEDRDMASEMMNRGNPPQLVMPSIEMPSRRPFTEKGKNMGKLKLLIAGDSGVGKTSLIRAIVKSCEDIVHVDPISGSVPTLPASYRKISGSKTKSGILGMATTSGITEIHASTKAYPAWWSDLEESKVLKRRKSMGDYVLERNLCFVDTPGYGSQTSFLEFITPVIDYVESHFKKTLAFEDLRDSEIINMLSGNGGAQVDVVLYVISDRLKPADVEYLRRLSHLTNIIPIIACADLYSEDQIRPMKEQILSELQSASIKPFLFGVNIDGSRNPSAPYAISTTLSKDYDNMDASLLMSPDYVQPLNQSELQVFVAQIFERDAISWLRYSAAKKFLRWKSSLAPTFKPQSLYRPLASPLTSQDFTAPVGAATSYALARITDHTQREERIAQIRLANWAADLQRSLQNERARFDNLARSERAVWLTKRLGECVQDGSIVPISQARKDPFYDSGINALNSTKHSRRDFQRAELRVDKNDPLGLLLLNAEIKRKGWFMLKIVSGFGIISGFAFCAARAWQESWSIGGLGVRDWIELGALDLAD